MAWVLTLPAAMMLVRHALLGVLRPVLSGRDQRARPFNKTAAHPVK